RPDRYFLSLSVRLPSFSRGPPTPGIYTLSLHDALPISRPRRRRQAMIPATPDRVAINTDARVNARIRRETLQRLYYYQHHLDEIEARLEELDREWDIERALEANAATLALSGALLGIAGARKALLLPAVVSAFLLQHAVQGWCPPLPLLRRLGFRTAREIETERHALRWLRGDLDEIDRDADIETLLPAPQS